MAYAFIRQHADEYKIDPDRIGVTGGSAGGHLSLMLATRGDAGDPNADDPLERFSSQVQAVAIFYPVTDLVDLGDSTENLRDGGPPKSLSIPLVPMGRTKTSGLASHASVLHYTSFTIDYLQRSSIMAMQIRWSLSNNPSDFVIEPSSLIDWSNW